MAISIELYQNSSSPETVDKALSLVSTVSGNLKDNTSIVDPVIIFEFSTVPTFNYVHIAAFNRYYFVKNITMIGTNLWMVEMHCDVLKSFASAIRANSALLDFSQTETAFLPDERFGLQNKRTFTVNKFNSSGLSKNLKFVLITAGGTSST